jgi:hypothetical protein
MAPTDNLNTKQERVEEKQGQSRVIKNRAMKVPYKPTRQKGREYRA